MPVSKLGATCVAPLFFLSATVSAQTVISELLYDASGSDAGKVFIELFGTPGDSLDGLVLQGVNGSNGSITHSLSLSGFIPDDGVYVIADDDGGGGTLVGNADLIADVDFQNGPDSVVLLDGDIILDALAYGVFGAGDVFAGETTAATATGAGSSLERLDVWNDTDNNFLDFVVQGAPTPGLVSGSVSAVPLPPALWLLGSGLLMGIGVARRRGS